MKIRTLAATAIAAAMLTGVAVAQMEHGGTGAGTGHGASGTQHGMDHGTPEASGAQHGTDHGTPAAGALDEAPSSKAFAEANRKMHEAMDIEFTGDADVDFVRGMIAHHEGAIEMAKILLEHGKDPELRALAEAIVSAQEAEVATMKAWLQAKGVN